MGGEQRGRAVILVLALIGIGYLWLQTRSVAGVRLSSWGVQGPAAVMVEQVIEQQGGLSGVAEQQGQGLANDLRPQGNPLGASNTVMTQGYGVGSHAPAEVWGAIDLALDSDGDGNADPQGSEGQPIYATHSGVIRVTPGSWPAGNHIWVSNDEYRTGYAHLSGFAVESGQTVARGTLIGYIGSTGASSGPHLDYQVWVKQGDTWVNQNPLGFGALDGTGQ